ncbi:beta-adrenergic receptor kinase 1-like [Cetorhinus maximus]
MLTQFNFYDQIRTYEKLGSEGARALKAKEIYHEFILRELLGSPEAFSPGSVSAVQHFLNKKLYPPDLFQPMFVEIYQNLSEKVFSRFLSSKHFIRYCQWKNVQLSIIPVMNDFRIDSLIQCVSFGNVYKCEKVDTGKIYSIKCYCKKHLKMKQAESLALNEQRILALLSEEECPFLVQLTYAFQTDKRLCYVLDYTVALEHCAKQRRPCYDLEHAPCLGFLQEFADRHSGIAGLHRA